MNNELKYLYSSGDSFSTPGTKKDYETDEVLNGESFKNYADIISEKNKCNRRVNISIFITSDRT